MKIFKSVALGFLCFTIISCGNTRVTSKNLETKIDSVSYALGMDMAIKIKANLGKIDTDLFIQGYINGVDSTGLLLKSEDLNIINAYYQQKKIEESNRQGQKDKEALEKNFGEVKRIGKEFLDYNKKMDGIVTTESGLQYLIIKEGNEKKPTVDSKVKVHYTGKLINGVVFESSKKNQQPSEFFVNQVMKGWIEGLQIMGEGAHYRFFIPEELAYGSIYKSELIRPFTALVFDIELIEVITTK
jgi:FKBP-type peptidyl-prolyl cis-trans isomerase